MGRSLLFAGVLVLLWGCSSDSGSSEGPASGGAAGVAGTGGSGQDAANDSSDCHVIGCEGGLYCCAWGCAKNCGDGGSPSGGTGGTGGTGAACSSISDDFSAALAQAKGCDLLAVSPECTLLVDTSIDACGSYQFVNPANSAAVAKLATDSQQWKALGCKAEICGVGGYASTTAKCVPSGSGADAGTCQSGM